MLSKTPVHHSRQHQSRSPGSSARSYNVGGINVGTRDSRTSSRIWEAEISLISGPNYYRHIFQGPKQPLYNPNADPANFGIGVRGGKPYDHINHAHHYQPSAPKSRKLYASFTISSE